MRLTVFLCLLAGCFLDSVRSKIFEKCELASALANTYNVSSEEVNTLVCIAEYESTFNTEAINHSNFDGSKDYGLFQLNNQYWCGTDFGQNTCRTSCESFLDDDLTDDLNCVKRIVKDTKRWMRVKDGYVAWVAYVNRCQNRDLHEYMSECSSASTTMTTAATSVPITAMEQMSTTSRPKQVPARTEIPDKTIHPRPGPVREPQIPISPVYRPIPVRVSMPKPVSVTEDSEDILRPSKTPLKKDEEKLLLEDSSQQNAQLSDIQEITPSLEKEYQKFRPSLANLAVNTPFALAPTNNIKDFEYYLPFRNPAQLGTHTSHSLLEDGSLINEINKAIYTMPGYQLWLNNQFSPIDKQTVYLPPTKEISSTGIDQDSSEEYEGFPIWHSMPLPVPPKMEYNRVPYFPLMNNKYNPVRDQPFIASAGIFPNRLSGSSPYFFVPFQYRPYPQMDMVPNEQKHIKSIISDQSSYSPAIFYGNPHTLPDYLKMNWPRQHKLPSNYLRKLYQLISQY